MLNLVVSAKYPVSDDVVCIELAAPEHGDLPPFTAGAHVDVELGEGLVRQYSLWNSPLETHRYCLGVALAFESRGGSKAVHELQVGTMVRVSEPRNLFPLEKADHTTLVACGIGITPILAMADELHRSGSEFTLHYRLRSRSSGAFVEALMSAPYSARVMFHESVITPTVDFNFEGLLPLGQGCNRIYVCGPGAFTDALRAAALSGGLPSECFHQELFATDVAVLEGDDTFIVHFNKSGISTSVPPGVSIAEAARAAGIALPTSCGQGICGTCLINVISGTPEHRDDYLTPAERDANDQILTCCSRSKSRELTLDL